MDEAIRTVSYSMHFLDERRRTDVREPRRIYPPGEGFGPLLVRGTRSWLSSLVVRPLGSNPSAKLLPAGLLHVPLLRDPV